MAPIDLPLHRAVQGGDHPGGLPQKLHPLAVVAQVIPAPQLLQPVVDVVLAFVQQTGEGLGPVFLDELVRVLCPLHPEDLHIQPRPLQQGDGPLGGGHPRPVAVVGDDRVLEVAGQQLGVLRGQRGAQGGHRAVKARLVEGDGVHIPLRQDHPPRPGLLGDVQGKYIAALVVHRRVRRVEVLGGGVIHHPAAEADHVPPDVDDREHDPVSEAVIDAAVLVAHRQPGVQQVGLVPPLLRQGRQQTVPAVGGEAQSEPGQGPPAQPAPLKVGQPRRPLRGVQPLVEHPGRRLVDGQQLFPPLLHAGAEAAGVRHLQVHPLGQHSHRVPEGQAVQLHDEVDGPAALPAAEALEDLLVRGDGKGGGLF